MDRNAALPERCVVCNDEAPKRIGRTLYWSPVGWRVFSFAAPVAVLAAGFALRTPVLIALFWPAIIVLGIANYFVRRKLKLELGVCARHRRRAQVVRALSVVALLGAVAVYGQLWSGGGSATLVVVAVVAVIVLAFAQRLIGVQKVSLTKLDSQYAWLGGTGTGFREGLPEAPGR